jgi:hypothetical protein
MESYFVYTNLLSPSPCNYSSAHAGDINVGGGRTNRARSRTLRRTLRRTARVYYYDYYYAFHFLN